MQAVANNVSAAWKSSLEFDVLIGLVTNANKSFFFSNHPALQSEIAHLVSILPEEQQLAARNSFKLVGSVIAARGAACTSYRDQRIQSAAEKLRKIRYAPVRFAHRVRMAGAIFKAAIFGTELIPLTEGQCEVLRSAVVSLFWKGRTWLRCWATTATHVIPVHLLHPQSACAYHILTLWYRLLMRREDIRNLLSAIRETPLSAPIKGPFSLLQRTMDNIGVSCYGTYKLSTHETSILDLLDPEPPAFKHHLRTCLRHFVLRTNTAYNARLDMQGNTQL